MREQRRTLKDAGALLEDHDVGRLGAKFMINAVAIGGNECLAARRLRARRPVMGTNVLGGVEDRNTGAPRGGEESLRRRDGAMGVDTARVGIARVELVGRVWPTTIDKIVEIDRQQRGPRAHEGLAPPAGIELEVRLRNDVAPAVVVKVVDGCHACLPVLAHSGDYIVRLAKM